MGKKSDRNGELNYGVVADRKVGIMHVYRYGNMEADIVLIQLVGNHDISEIKDEVAEIQHLTSMDFELIAVKVDDWNKELSPWKTPAVFGNEDFGDGAVQTLEEILLLCSDKSKTYYIGGYSLSGLFHYGCLSDRSVLRDCGSIAVCLVSGIYRLYERV